jgi:glutamine amidotransferase
MRMACPMCPKEPADHSNAREEVAKGARTLSERAGCANLLIGRMCARLEGVGNAMTERVTIVDYHAGNLTSVRLAVEKLGREALVTSEPEHVRSATRLIFPGVGAAGAAMGTLRGLGLDAAMRDYCDTGRPLLGICLGAQIILEHSGEDDVPCLGLIEGCTRRLEVPPEAKIPHMGWNNVRQVRRHPIWHGIADDSQFYFVHSYAPAPADTEAAIGTTDYYCVFVSALARDNIVAFQFHPERSGRTGMALLDNFLRWEP